MVISFSAFRPIRFPEFTDDDDEYNSKYDSNYHASRLLLLAKEQTCNRKTPSTEKRKRVSQKSDLYRQIVVHGVIWWWEIGGCSCGDNWTKR